MGCDDDPQQFNQLVRSLEQVVLQLNSNYTPITTENKDQAQAWFFWKLMANSYKRFVEELTATVAATVLTVPAATTAIVKSIWVANDGASSS
jgi:murein tripeptide amidase MpaA